MRAIAMAAAAALAALGAARPGSGTPPTAQAPDGGSSTGPAASAPADARTSIASPDAGAGPKYEPGQLVGADGAPLGWDALVARASEADFILVGEGHLNVCDHRIQARTLVALSDAGLAPAVGLEMVGVVDQPLLDHFNKGRIPVADLGEALRWPATWGYPYSLYRPIFEVAREHELPVIALNIPSVAARAIASRNIELEHVHPRDLVPPEVIAPPADHVAALTEEFERHGGLVDDDRRPFGRDPLERFLYVQSLWDTQMASQAIRTAKRLERPVVVIAGAGHVERSGGIPYRLQVLAPSATVLAMMPLREGEKPDATSGDVFFYCP